MTEPNDDLMALTFELTGPIGISDKLMRAQPASREGQPDVWELAKTVIDHAAFILVTASGLRPEHRILDLVLATLLRRAIITAEAIRALIEAGLEEPSLATFRTLLDIELNTRLIVSDDTGRMARRFAAYHSLTAKRHGTRILQHPETRRILLGGEEDLASTKEWTKRWAEYLRDPVFDDVREAVAERRNWHGYDSVEAAFSAVGADGDYRMLYEVFTPFVHASNPESDLDGLSGDGAPMMKALPQRDPRITRGRLGGTLLVLCRILDEYLTARDSKDYPDTITGRNTNTGEGFTTTPLTFLRAQIVSVINDDLPSTSLDEVQG